MSALQQSDDDAARTAHRIAATAGAPAALRAVRTRYFSPGIVGQLLRFGTTTGLSACLSFGLPVLLREAVHITPEAAVPIGFVVAFVFNFFGLRYLVFRSVHRSFLRDLATFGASSLGFRTLEYVTFLFLLHVAELHYAVALGAVLVIGTAAKFLWYRKVMPRDPVRSAL